MAWWLMAWSWTRNPDQDRSGGRIKSWNLKTERRGQNDGFTVGVEKHTIKDQTLRIKIRIGEQESKDLQLIQLNLFSLFLCGSKSPQCLILGREPPCLTPGWIKHWPWPAFPQKKMYSSCKYFLEWTGWLDMGPAGCSFFLSLVKNLKTILAGKVLKTKNLKT